MRVMNTLQRTICHLNRISSRDSGKKSSGPLRESVEELEKKLIVESMEKTQDNQTKAAEILGISERMLRYKLKKYGLKN